MTSSTPLPVESADRVPPLTGAPIGADCDQALQWSYSWLRTLRSAYQAAGTWASASLLMQLLIENEHGVEHDSAARDDEWVTALGIGPEEYRYALTRLENMDLIEIAVVPVNGEETKIIRLVKGRFKRYTLTAGDITTSFWGLVGSKMRCS